MELKGKNVLVIGAARSGLAAAKLLNGLGACVTLADSKEKDKLPEDAKEMESIGVQLCAGENPCYDLIKKQTLIIASPGIPADMEAFVIARKEGIPVMGELELAFMLCPCPVAAITGTNGKTTTSAWAGEIIGRHIADTRVVGNIGLPFCECVSELKESSFAVVEASSFQLEAVSVFKPKISAVLNITPDHLDRHKTMEKYIEAKTNIYKNTDEGCVVILNKDDPLLNGLSIETGATILYFSALGEVEQGAYLEDGDIILKYNGKRSKLIKTDELTLLGEHNIENALAASVIAACAGTPEDIITRGLAEFKGVPHRLEFVRELSGVRYYNDSKGTNPEASIKAVGAMRGGTVLIAGGYDKKADFTALVSLFDEKLSHLIVLGQTKQEIINACEKVGFRKYTAVDDYEQAVALAHETAARGEDVLLSPACASWDMFPDFEKRGEYFKKLVNLL